MQKSYKKTFGLISSAIFLGIIMAPTVFAASCDKDGDKYITISYNQMQEVVLDNLEYKPDGSYSPEQWNEFFDTYKKGIEENPGLNDVYVCENMNFMLGAEPAKCDDIEVSPTSGIYDTSKVDSLSGKKVNPGEIDLANNGIDENCDGKDAGLLDSAGLGEDKDLEDVDNKIISFLSRAIVIISIAVLIFGGILYSLAAGNERKVSIARKTIIGAVIGLLVGLLAPTIVNFIVANL
ncbi:hypothetical protein JW758_01295 [Candidatus Peregrinibacteria bacterium]|nr:hypothetical protein [Candidatus Peregrinibacteria bacterium]